MSGLSNALNDCAKTDNDDRQHSVVRTSNVFDSPFRPRRSAIGSSDCEATQFHDTCAEGYFAILVRKALGSKDKKQICHPLTEMPFVIEKYRGIADVWISQGAFHTKRSRRGSGLKYMKLCFSDLDTYNVPALKDKTPCELLNVAGYSGRS